MISDSPQVKGIQDIDYPDEEDQPPVTVVNKKTAKKKNFAPEIMLIDPKPRNYLNFSAFNSQPCGETEKSQVHYLATPGSKNYV